MSTPARQVIRVALFTLLFVPAKSDGAPIGIYTFEQFADGLVTPLLDVAPDSGGLEIRASFTSGPQPGELQIAEFQPNVLFSGHTLYAPSGVFDALTVTFDRGVLRLSFDFATNGPGSLILNSVVWNGAMLSSGPLDGGPGSPGGTFEVVSTLPLTSFTIRAVDLDGNPVEFAIDDLTVTEVVPEPALLLLVAVAVVVRGLSPFSG